MRILLPLKKVDNMHIRAVRAYSGIIMSFYWADNSVCILDESLHFSVFASQPSLNSVTRYINFRRVTEATDTPVRCQDQR